MQPNMTNSNNDGFIPDSSSSNDGFVPDGFIPDKGFTPGELDPTRSADWSGFGHNVAEGIKAPYRSGQQMGAGLAKTIFEDVPETRRQMNSVVPRSVGDSVNAFRQSPLGQDIDRVGGAIADFPGQIVKQIGQTVMHPYQSIKEQPVETGLLGLSFLGGPKAPGAAEAPVSATPNIFQKGVAKATSALFGPKSDAILERMKNPQAIQNAAPLTDISSNLSSAAAKLQSQIEDASSVARDTLSREYHPDAGAFAKTSKGMAVAANDVASAITEAKKSLGVFGGGVVGPADQKAVQLLDSLQGDINSVGKYVGGKVPSSMGVPSIVPRNAYLPEATVGDIIRKLDANIDWANESATVSNTMLEKVRTKLDGLLKSQNPDYQKAMTVVDEKMRLMNNLKKQFNVSSVPGGDWQPGTATESKLSNLLGPNKSMSLDTLKQLQQHTGDDILSQVKNNKTAQAFTGGSPNGSRRVAFGTVVGTTAGKLFGNPAAGAVSGATAGLLADSYGGAMAAKIADVLSNQKFAKYASVLENAAKESPEGLAATQSRLLTKDPEYADAINGTQTLNEGKAREYLRKAKGDKALARQMAKSDGWSF